MTEILLTPIYDAIDKIGFKNPNHTLKARDIIRSVFREYITDEEDINFNIPKPFPNKWFRKIVTKPSTNCLILTALKNAEILLTNGKYFTGNEKIKAYCKHYVINPNLIYTPKIHFTQFKGVNRINDRIIFKEMKSNLEQIKVDPSVYNFIPEVVENHLSKIKINEQIKDEIITINNVYKSRKYWLAVANRQCKALIKFNNKFYIDGVMSFKKRKSTELNIIYTFQIKNIDNGNFYANRNITNRRLDHNLTSLKKELMQFIILENEKTVEIDINNAQFALLSNLPQFDLDTDFIHHAQSGDLYEYVMKKMDMTRCEVKKYMMIALFGKVNNHPKSLKNLFPVTMQSISDFKNEHGYKSFSVYLQNAESNLMIDGLFNLLAENNISTIPIHDSIRVRESDYRRVKKLMITFFENKNFKCGLKNK